MPKSTLERFWQYIIKDVRYLASILSFLFSLWACFNTGIINLDGILYVKITTQMLSGNWQAIPSSFHLNFLPLVMMVCCKITGLSPETSAYLLSAVFSALLTYAFLSILTLFTSKKRILLLGALVVVFHPELIETKHKILRDHGFWAFYMLSVCYFLKFYRKPVWQYAILWSLCIGGASLFRYEGIVLFCAIPCVVFVREGWSLKRKTICFFQAHFGLIFLLVLCLSTGWLGFLVEKYSVLSGQYATFITSLTTGVAEKVKVVESVVLPSLVDEYAWPIVLLMPLVMVLGKVLGGITPLYAIMLLGSRRLLKQFFENSMGIRVLLWVGILNLSIYFGFSYAQFFIQSRYVMPLVLLILLLVPFVLEVLIQAWENCEPGFHVKKIGLVVLVLGLTVNFLEGVVSSGDSKLYIKESGNWLSKNILDGATVFSNNPKVTYYSGRFSQVGAPRFYIDRKWMENPPDNYDYYALVFRKKNQSEYEDTLRKFGIPWKEIVSKDSHRIIVYKSISISNVGGEERGG